MTSQELRAHGDAGSLTRGRAQAQARRVTAGEELDEHRVRAAVAVVVCLQLGSQPARLHAYDRVHARIVRRLAIEDFHADQVFL